MENKNLILSRTNLPNKIHYPELDKLFNWDKLYSISPEDIKFTASFGLDLLKNEWEKVYDGNWDDKLPIEQDFVYESVIQLLRDNIPFSQTPLYLASVEMIKQGYERWGCKTEEEFASREQIIRNTYELVKEYGFKTQQELTDLTFNPYQHNGKYMDEPGIFIGHGGRYLYHNGNHRMPIFRLLNIPEIKVKVNARHKEWVDFLLYVKDISYKIWGENKVYQPVNHVDFEHYNTEWSNYRLELIKSNLFPESKTVLDIGALWGYFSSGLESQGLQCTAVENNKDFAYIMTKLRYAQNKNFEIYEGNIFDLQNTKYDVILALNIFHHFLKSKEGYDKLTNFLNNLQVKEIYLQTHQPEEKQMQGAYRNFDSLTFVDYVRINSHLTQYKEIGEELGRKIYKIY